ncbi:MAG: hypothetical protein JWN34_1955, partial [Bryobacterales bacterium]|nr:hypothetical protein [Bryobacterales bacterium]
WTDRLGRSCAPSRRWLEQNPAKASKWAKLAREGHDIAWQMAAAGGSYTGLMLIDGEVYDTHDAAKKFLKGGSTTLMAAADAERSRRGNPFEHRTQAGPELEKRPPQRSQSAVRVPVADELEPRETREPVVADSG